MPECIFKVLRSSKFTAQLGGNAIDLFVSECSFTPNRRYPQKVERHEGQLISAVRNAWNGHEDEWNGNVVGGGKVEGSVVYVNVPFSPLFWANSEDGSICGARLGGEAKVIGFLNRIGASRNGTGGTWIIENTFLYSGVVQKIGSMEKYRELGSIKDGRVHIELVPLQ